MDLRIGIYRVSEEAGADGSLVEKRTWLPTALYRALKNVFTHDGRVTVHTDEAGRQYVWRTAKKSLKRRKYFIHPKIETGASPPGDASAAAAAAPVAEQNVVVNVGGEPPRSLYSSQMALMGPLYAAEAVRAASAVRSASAEVVPAAAAAAAAAEASVDPVIVEATEEQARQRTLRDQLTQDILQRLIPVYEKSRDKRHFMNTVSRPVFKKSALSVTKGDMFQVMESNERFDDMSELAEVIEARSKDPRFPIRSGFTKKDSRIIASAHFDHKIAEITGAPGAAAAAVSSE